MAIRLGIQVFVLLHGLSITDSIWGLFFLFNIYFLIKKTLAINLLKASLTSLFLSVYIKGFSMGATIP